MPINQEPHPWRRYFAWVLDTQVCSVIWWAIMALVLRVNIANTGIFWTLLDLAVTLVLVLFLVPLQLRFFGTTVGKAVFGLKIKTQEGENPTYEQAFYRTAGMIGKGIGYSIPIYSLVRLWKSYRCCMEGELLPWEEQSELVYTISDTKWYRAAGYLASMTLLFMLYTYMMLTQWLPPNRGEITVEQFAQNFNYYAKYYDLELLGKLNADGKWETQVYDQEASVYYVMSAFDIPMSYEYTLQDGIVKGVSISVEIVDNTFAFTPYDNQLLLAALSFICAQKEITTLTLAPQKIEPQLTMSKDGNYAFDYAGIRVTRETKTRGYPHYTGYMIVPYENAKENYYSLTFTMTKE